MKSKKTRATKLPVQEPEPETSTPQDDPIQSFTSNQPYPSQTSILQPIKPGSRPPYRYRRVGGRITSGRNGDTGPDCVGILRCRMNGQNVKIRIELNKVLKFGRGPESDVRFHEEAVSTTHLRTYAYRTTSRHSIICVHDLSHSGFILNGTRQYPPKAIRIDGKRFTQRTTVLQDGDIIQLPGCPTHFTLHLNHHHAPDSLFTSQIHQPTPIFRLTSSKSYILGPFTIHNHPLGEGTYGVVNLATITSDKTNLQLACKTVLLSSLRDIDISQEVDILRKVSHPNILGLIGLIEEEEMGRMHLIQELATGGDLFAYMEKHYTGLGEDEVRFLGWQLVEGLKYLHGNGIVHRADIDSDIKPENVLLHISSSYPRILIGDFGHATSYNDILNSLPKADDEFEKLVASAVPTDNVGTTNYLPPERLYSQIGRQPALIQISKKKKGTTGTVARREELARKLLAREMQLDIWALGCVLHFCVSAAHPYEISSRSDVSPVDISPPQDIRPSQMEMKTSNIRGSTDEKDHTGWKRFTNLDRAESGLDDVDDALTEIDRFENTDEDMGDSRNGDGPAWVLGLALAFTRASSDQWWPPIQWYDYSEECKNFISSLMMEDPDDRLQIEDAGDHPWMIDSAERGMEASYDWIVIQGESLTKA